MADSLAISPGARDALQGWLDHIRALDGAAANTVEAYRADVAGFLAFMAGHTGGEQGRAALARVGLREMRAPFMGGQGLTSKRQRLRVHIETQQESIRRASLQNAASVSARAQCAIYISAARFGLQRVYNLLVKYRFVRHLVC